VRRNRPGIAKAVSLSADLNEDVVGSTIVRSVLSDLDALIANRGRRPGAAFAWGTPERGGARLVHGLDTEGAESLKIHWNHSKIKNIEIESRNEMGFSAPESPIDPAEMMVWLVPRLWAHIQRGGALPVGIDRFASFF
jgi:hypothetical protein